MKVLIAGSHGMIGSAVTRRLIENDHEIVRLVRSTPGAGEVWWNPDAGKIDAPGLEGFDAVIQLASMRWPMRWTRKAKEKLRVNRIATYRSLAESLAACMRKPRILVCASGIGVYPSSGDEILTEDTAPCSSFLSDVDLEGEMATAVAEAAGIRVVHLRIPQVMGGTALQFVGFRAGDGQQWISWVGRDELASIVEFVLRTESLSGPVNAVSPNPMRNAEFAATATRALGLKPGGVMPVFIVRLVMGESGKIILFMLPSLIAAIWVHTNWPQVVALPERFSFIKPMGFLLLLLGLTLWGAGVIQLMSGFSKGKLVTTGAYGVVRNPIYSSVAFFILPGIALLTLTWVYLVVSIFLYAGVMIFIGTEEKQLTKAFGKQYEDYLARVDRLVPFKKPEAKEYLLFGRERK